MKAVLATALGMSLALALAACGDEAGDTDNIAETNVTAPMQSNEKIADLLDEADGLDTVSALVDTAGLETVLSGVGPYTLFAPSDDAFKKALGDDRIEAMKDEKMRAEDAALLKAHLVPGLLTRQDIGAAIDRAGGSATMTTIAGGTLTFTRSGQGIAVTSDTGAKAMLAADETVAANGAIEPVNGLLVPVEAPATG
jgi:uncharacterized surface protein with fasciclin (FAS1) repeats